MFSTFSLCFWYENNIYSMITTHLKLHSTTMNSIDHHAITLFHYLGRLPTRNFLQKPKDCGNIPTTQICHTILFSKLQNCSSVGGKFPVQKHIFVIQRQIPSVFPVWKKLHPNSLCRHFINREFLKSCIWVRVCFEAKSLFKNLSLVLC